MFKMAESFNGGCIHLQEIVKDPPQSTTPTSMSRKIEEVTTQHEGTSWRHIPSVIQNK